MSERVLKLTGPVAVELAHDGLELTGAGSDRPLEERIDIVHIQMEAHRRATEAFRRLAAVLREFIRQHDERVAEADLGVADASVGHRQLVALDRSERLFVEL